MTTMQTDDEALEEELSQPAYVDGERHARSELSRYYQGEALERQVQFSLRAFANIHADITQFRYMEEMVFQPEKGVTVCNLSWQKLSSLQ